MRTRLVSNARAAQNNWTHLVFLAHVVVGGLGADAGHEHGGAGGALAVEVDGDHGAEGVPGRAQDEWKRKNYKLVKLLSPPIPPTMKEFRRALT